MVPLMRDLVQERGLNALCVWAKQNGADGRAVEIGAYAGEGTAIFGRHFAEVVSIDPWLNGYDNGDVASHQCPMKWVHREWLERTRDLPNVRCIRGTSAGAASHFGDGSLDFVYIDGDHRYEAVRSDLELYRPKLRKGGVLAGHDLSFNAMQQALGNVLGKETQFTVFDGDNWGLVT
jgi:predicted O-methyltransferase YrrM